MAPATATRVAEHASPRSRGNFVTSLLAPFLVLQALVAGDMERFRRDVRAMINLSGPMAIISVIIGGFVLLIIIAALLPTFFTGLADTNAALTDPNTTTGDATADSLLTVFPILIGLAGLFFIIGLIFLAFKARKA